MKIRLYSDLHLEYFRFNPPPNQDNCDVLILAGDILNLQDIHEIKFDQIVPALVQKFKNNVHERVKRYKDFFDSVTKQYRHVIYVAGNHEFYHGKWKGNLNDAQYLQSIYSNLHFLEDQHVVIDSVQFYGCTMWTDCHNQDHLTKVMVQSNMNDYRIIRNDERNYGRLTTSDSISRHLLSKRKLQNFLQAADKTLPVVVITHHAPCSKSVSADYKDDHHMNGGYYSELSNLILDNDHIKLWCHGHMHNSSNYQIGNCTVLANPRGYMMGDECENECFQETYFLNI